MREIDGRWVCEGCGAVLEVPDGEHPNVTIHAGSGQSNVRVLMLHGVEIHQCEIKKP